MKRGIFLGTAAGMLLMPRAARAARLDLAAVVDTIPGITGVYARTLGSDPPVTAVRAGEPFASASVIKLAIMATAYRAFDARTAAPGDLVTLRASDLIGGSPVFAGVPAGRRVRLQALIDAMIRQSDNSASNALITAFGFGAVNGVIRAAGMNGTRLGRHFADVVPAWHVSANVTTPRDTGTLLYLIAHGAREGLDTIASSRSCRAMIDVLLGQEDKTKIAQGLPRGTPIANKTGEIDGVRNDAAIVDPYGDAPYVLVVLTRRLRDTSAGDRGIAAIARRVDAVLRAGG